MKLIIDEDKQYEETEIRISCPVVTREIEEIIALIRLHTFSFSAHKDGQTYLMSLNDIWYFESVDGHTFAYTAEDVYETDLRLYQLEDELQNTRFIRISKSVLLNLTHLKSVRPLSNGRMAGSLSNGEDVIINRRFVSQLKRKLGL